MKRAIITILVLTISLLLWNKYHDPSFPNSKNFGNDLMMVRHAAQGDFTWWERYSGTHNIWQGYLYSNQTWIYAWTTIGSEQDIILFMYLLGTFSYWYIAWRLCALHNGFLLALAGLRIMAWYLPTGNIALAVGLLCVSPILSVPASILKPTSLGPLAIHAFRYTISGSKNANTVSRQSMVDSSSVFEFGDQILYILVAWFYAAYTLSDHYYYGTILYFLPL
jgi:hypothetical protein